MILDALTKLGSAQSVTTTAVTTSTYDAGSTTRDLTIGEPMGLAFEVISNTGTSETVQFQVVTATAADGTTGQVVCNTTAALTVAQLAAGTKFFLPFGVNVPGQLQRYIAGKYVVASQDGTKSITCHLLPQSSAENLKYFPIGYTLGF